MLKGEKSSGLTVNFFIFMEEGGQKCIRFSSTKRHVYAFALLMFTNKVIRSLLYCQNFPLNFSALFEVILGIFHKQ